MGLQSKFLLRLPSALHERFTNKAKLDGTSLNSMYVKAIEHSLYKTSDSSRFSEVMEALILIYGPSLISVVLFGSQARGTARTSSDIDLLLVFNEKTSISRSLYSLWDKKFSLKKFSNVSIHCVHRMKTLEQPGSLWLEIAIDGIILKDDDGRTTHRISRLRRVIAEGKFIRKEVHGHGYWITSKQAVSA